MKTLTRLKQKGVGLLELMLSLAIIALLLIMATKYYSSAHTSQQVNQAIEAMHAIYAASETYMANNPTGSGLTTGTGVQTLVSDGLLPTDFGGSTAGTGASLENPWRGTFDAVATAATGTSPQSVAISMTNVPDGPCNSIFASLAQTLSGSDTVQGGEATFKAGSSTATSCSTSNGDGGTTGSNTITVTYYN